MFNLKRPAVWTALSLISGILLGQYISERLCIALFAIIIILIFIDFAVKIFNPAVFIIPLFAVLGFILININSLNNVKDLKFHELVIDSHSFTVDGTICNISFTSTGKAIVKVKSDTIYKDGIAVSDEPIVLYTICGNTSYLPGDKITAFGEIKCFNEKDNPSDFNQNLYYRTRGYDYIFYPEDITVYGKEPIYPNRFYYIISSSLKSIYDNILNEEDSGIIKAIMLGDKSDIDSDIKELYRRAGIIHIIAISGMHISILSAAIYFVLTKLFKFKDLAASVISILFLANYSLLTGSSPSTVRAVLMMSIYYFSSILFREKDSLSSIAVACIIILIFNPLYLFDVGFQLSFLTALGIILSSAIVDKSSLNKTIKKLCIVQSLFAVMISAPVVAYNYFEVPVISIFINILVLPLMSLLFIMSLISGVIGLVSLTAAEFLAGIVHYILVFYKIICTKCVLLPFSVLKTGRPSLAVILAYYLLFFAICFYKKGSGRKIIVPLIILAAVISFERNFNGSEAAFLYVGQGDCSVVTASDGTTVVIDTGGLSYREIGNNTGKNVIIPYLELKGKTKIDALILSHLDYDHSLGAIELLDNYEIGAVIMPAYSEFILNDLYYEIIRRAEEKNIAVYKASYKDSFSIGSVYVDCIYPMTEDISDDGHLNDYSLCFILETEDSKILYTGDIELNGEIDILLSDENINCDIIKIPHHGSKTSSSPEFLYFADADYSVISCGKNNIYNHPDAEVISNLKKLNTQIYVTKDNGAVIFNLKNGRINVSTER